MKMRILLFLAIGCMVSGTALRASTFMVSNPNDMGAGSLRQAINDNNATGGNTIVFDSNVFGHQADNAPLTVQLTSSELLVTRDVTITGLGRTITAIVGGVNNTTGVAVVKVFALQ